MEKESKEGTGDKDENDSNRTTRRKRRTPMASRWERQENGSIESSGEKGIFAKLTEDRFVLRMGVKKGERT